MSGCYLDHCLRRPDGLRAMNDFGRRASTVWRRMPKREKQECVARKNSELDPFETRSCRASPDCLRCAFSLDVLRAWKCWVEASNEPQVLESQSARVNLVEHRRQQVRASDLSGMGACGLVRHSKKEKSFNVHARRSAYVRAFEHEQFAATGNPAQRAGTSAAH